MHRTVAVVALLGLSWSQLVALRCDMGNGVSGAIAGAAATHRAVQTHPAAPTHHAAPTHLPAPLPHTAPAHPVAADAHAHAPERAPLAQHGRSHEGDHGCMMIMACNYASVRHAQSTTLMRFPAIFLRAVFLPNPIPAAAPLAVETPPPRLAV